MRQLIALCFAASLAASSWAQGTWTVDDDGPADFSSVAAAVAFADPGDRILIEPGNYGPVVIDKELTLLGRHDAERPRIRHLRATDLPGLQLQHLDLGHVPDAIRFARIVGRLVADDLIVRSGVEVVDCRDAVFTGCEITGVDGFDGGAGLVARGLTHVQLVLCTVRGGEGIPMGGESGFGGTGAFVQGGAHLLLAGGVVAGGASYAGGFVSSADGGDGLCVGNDSSVDLRGSSIHGVYGGPSDGGGSSSGVLFTPSSQVSYGGLDLDFVVIPPNVTHYTPGLPYLRVSGESGPGDVQTLDFFGRSGAPAVALTSIEPSRFPLDPITTIYLAPGSILEILPLVLAGMDVPAQHTWTIPPDASLLGVAYYVQGLQLTFSGGLRGTNVDQILIGF